MLPWEWLKAEIGQQEIPGRKANPRIIEYRKIAGIGLKGDDGAVPWCRIAIVAAFVQAKLPIERSAMARAVEHDPWFERLTEPLPWAVVSMWAGSPNSGHGHTGLLYSSAKTYIGVLGGNQHDGLNVAHFPTRTSAIGVVGYYWHKQLPKTTAADWPRHMMADTLNSSETR